MELGFLGSGFGEDFGSVATTAGRHTEELWCVGVGTVLFPSIRWVKDSSPASRSDDADSLHALAGLGVESLEAGFQRPGFS